VTALLGAARRALAHESAADPELAALEKRLDEVAYLAPTWAPSWPATGSGSDADPARLAAVEERRAALNALVRKYGDVEGTVDEVLVWSATAAEPAGHAGRVRGRAGRAGRPSGTRPRRRRPRWPPSCPGPARGGRSGSARP
jgi:hypothetical protein